MPYPHSMASTPAANAAVSIAGVSKRFRIPSEQMNTLKERALHPRRRGGHETLTALEDVSLDVEKGEFFGIVGRNGSGKSTLMKCIAGIYRPDAGDIWLRGRLAPFIELGVGFNPEFSARDNVQINAIMFGLTPAEARARFDRIIDFAELREFVDMKLKNYSSGMQVRLAFSVMVHVDADVLLIDEVLAVGDAAFQQKCQDVLLEMRDAGRTIVLVTHNMNAVQKFCHRAALLERGSVVEMGHPRDVARRYEEINFEDASTLFDTGPGGDDRDVRVLDAWFENAQGDRSPSVPHGEPLSACMEVEFKRPVNEPVFGFVLTDANHETAFAATSAWKHGPTGTFNSGERATIRTTFDNVLSQGRYALSPEVSDGGQRPLAHRQGAASVVVTGGREGAGQMDLPNSFTVDRTATVAPTPAVDR